MPSRPPPIIVNVPKSLFKLGHAPIMVNHADQRTCAKKQVTCKRCCRLGGIYRRSQLPFTIKMTSATAEFRYRLQRRVARDALCTT